MAERWLRIAIPECRYISIPRIDMLLYRVELCVFGMPSITHMCYYIIQHATLRNGVILVR